MLQTKTNYNTLFIIIKNDHCSAPFRHSGYNQGVYCCCVVHAEWLITQSYDSLAV